MKPTKKTKERKESLKDWIKEWSWDDIVSNIYSEGIKFALQVHPRQLVQKDADEYRKIIMSEIKRRTKKSL